MNKIYSLALALTVMVSGFAQSIQAPARTGQWIYATFSQWLGTIKRYG